MKKIVLLAFMANSFLGHAQLSYDFLSSSNDDNRITVTGSASMEIVPDEIYLQVDLKEYEKKGIGKVDIEQIKKGFLQACKDAGIADSCISVYNYEGSNGKFWALKKKRNTEDLKATMSYWVQLNNPSKVDELVNRLDDDATLNFFIAEVTHSKITEYRKQLKIQAIKAAKEKAIYLTEAIGEKVGKAVRINEPDESNDSDRRDNYRLSNTSNFSTNYYSNGNSESESDGAKVDFKKIKLRYEVAVVFALQ